MVTKNYNMLFKSGWLGATFSINGEELKVGKDYNYDEWNWLDATTAYHMQSNKFQVLFQDNPAAEGALASAVMSHWAGGQHPNA